MVVAAIGVLCPKCSENRCFVTAVLDLWQVWSGISRDRAEKAAALVLAHRRTAIVQTCRSYWVALRVQPLRMVMSQLTLRLA
jgi:hypothetical protein